MRLYTALTAVEDLLTPPERWTQGAFCRDDGGVYTNIYSPFAYCYCLSGAMGKVLNIPVMSVVEVLGRHPLTYALWEVLPDDYRDRGLTPIGDVVAFNDHKNHQQVLALIKLAKKSVLERGVQDQEVATYSVVP